MTPVHVINENVPGNILFGAGTVGTSEQPVSDIDYPLRRFVMVRAESSNSDVVIVGTPGKASAGWVLAAGESTPRIPIDSTRFISVVGGDAGQQYRWLGL